MGEFEQAKPIIEGLKRLLPDTAVIASFFSPSGYVNSKRYPHADYVTYLPFDSRRNARRFVSILKPTVCVLIRYDIWPNHLWECERKQIPVILANATMRKDSKRHSYGLRSFHRKLFNATTSILTVSASDAENFSNFWLRGPSITSIGDTRYDRVEEKARDARKKALLAENVLDGKTIIVCGSTWSEDEEVLLPVLFKLLRHDPSLLFVIVPHEPTIEHLETLEYKLSGKVNSIRFSHLSSYAGESVLLVDSIGILLPLYASADVAFVGGAFKSNVHNTLEPAVYGIPVVYGPKIFSSQEANELTKAGGGFVVGNKRELYRILRKLLQDTAFRNTRGAIAGTFVHTRAGATERILAHLLPYFE